MQFTCEISFLFKRMCNVILFALLSKVVNPFICTRKWRTLYVYRAVFFASSSSLVRETITPLWFYNWGADSFYLRIRLDGGRSAFSRTPVPFEIRFIVASLPRMYTYFMLGGTSKESSLLTR